MRNEKELFFYTYAPIVLAPGASQSLPLTVDGDADFDMKDIMGYVRDNVTGLQTDCLVRFRDDMTSKTVQSQPTFSRLVFTNAEAIAPLPVERTIVAKTTFTAEVSNPNANAITVYISLRGYKRFDLVKK